MVSGLLRFWSLSSPSLTRGHTAPPAAGREAIPSTCAACATLAGRRAGARHVTPLAMLTHIHTHIYYVYTYIFIHMCLYTCIRIYRYIDRWIYRYIYIDR